MDLILQRLLGDLLQTAVQGEHDGIARLGLHRNGGIGHFAVLIDIDQPFAVLAAQLLLIELFQPVLTDDVVQLIFDAVLLELLDIRLGERSHMSEDMGCHTAARIAPGRALLH